jgi:hypothetical protein
MLTILDIQDSFSGLGWSILYVRIILDFLMKVIIILSRSHKISTQRISICMPHAWSVDYLEAEIL